VGTNSPNIGLNIPTPNDPAVANVWPSLWNTNAGMIDSSIAGLLPLDVSGAANVTLTFTNGSPSQTDNAIFVFSGVLSGNIDILFPNGKTKLFMVKNSTTGAFTLSLGANSTGSPGTPAGSIVGVPQGATGMFYSDGTNVFSAFPTTFVNPTFTGTVTMPGGGTWTSAAVSNAPNIGIGCAPSYALDILGAGATFHIKSTSDNCLARFENDQLEFGYVGSAGAVLGSGFSNRDFAVRGVEGLFLDAGTGKNMQFSIAQNRAGAFLSDTSFIVGTSLVGAGAGCIGATGTITQSYSDMRLKTKLGNVRGALAKVMSLDVFYYRRNRKAVSLGFKGKRDVGLSAQQVKKVLSEAVVPAVADPDYLTIRYERLVVLTIAAIKEQQGQIEALKREVATLKRGKR
jgi:hypothetical protein